MTRHEPHLSTTDLSRIMAELERIRASQERTEALLS
jgi:hypothetical protein